MKTIDQSFNKGEISVVKRIANYCQRRLQEGGEKKNTYKKKKSAFDLGYLNQKKKKKIKKKIV